MLHRMNSRRNYLEEIAVGLLKRHFQRNSQNDELRTYFQELLLEEFSRATLVKIQGAANNPESIRRGIPEKKKQETRTELPLEYWNIREDFQKNSQKNLKLEFPDELLNKMNEGRSYGPAQSNS